MSDGNADGGRAGQRVFALFEAAAAAHPDRPFLVVDDKPSLTRGAMLDETGRAAAWLDPIGVARRDRAMVRVRRSPAAVVRDRPSASVFMGVPTFHARPLTEKTP